MRTLKKQPAATMEGRERLFERCKTLREESSQRVGAVMGDLGTLDGKLKEALAMIESRTPGARAVIDDFDFVPLGLEGSDEGAKYKAAGPGQLNSITLDSPCSERNVRTLMARLMLVQGQMIGMVFRVRPAEDKVKKVSGELGALDYESRQKMKYGRIFALSVPACAALAAFEFLTAPPPPGSSVAAWAVGGFLFSLPALFVATCYLFTRLSWRKHVKKDFEAELSGIEREMQARDSGMQMTAKRLIGECEIGLDPLLEKLRGSEPATN